MKKSIVAIFLFAIISLAVSCTNDDPEQTDEENIEIPDAGDIPSTDTDLVPNTQVVTYDNAITIAFSTQGVTVTNPFEGAGVTIVKTNSHVAITSTILDKELNYILSGVTTNGSVKIYGEYKCGIVLNGVGITNPKGAAINIQCGKKITVTVVDQTNNRLVDGATYEYVTNEDMKATLFSEGQLNFYGKGNLEIRGKNKHAICSDDYLRIYDANITTVEAASDAIHANDYIRIDGGNLTLRSTGEGLDCEEGYVAINGGIVNITTTGEKAHGLKSFTYTTIAGASTILDVTVHGKASKCIKSTTDATIEGGTINLSTAGNAFYDTSDSDIASAAGINCDANCQIKGGTLTIACTGSGGKGISANGTFTMTGGEVKVTTSGGVFKYGSDDTSAKAIKSDGNLTVDAGKITIKTTGVEAEGLESKATLTINGGDISIEAYDDCINATSHIAITGGTVYCYSTTNDGIDSNGTIAISGGVVVTAGSTSPEEGFDCDQNQFKITGGTMVGIGGATSNPTASVCTQRSLVYSPTATSIQIIHIVPSTGSGVLTIKLPRTYTSRMTMLFSSSALAASTSYTIYTGGSISGGTDFHGLYTGATYTKGTSTDTFTTTSMLTTVGTSQSPGGK